MKHVLTVKMMKIQMWEVQIKICSNKCSWEAGKLMEEIA